MCYLCINNYTADFSHLLLHALARSHTLQYSIHSYTLSIKYNKPPLKRVNGDRHFLMRDTQKGGTACFPTKVIFLLLLFESIASRTHSLYAFVNTEPFNVIDLFATAPFWVDLILRSVFKQVTVLRALRLLRVFRVIRAAKSAIYVQILIATVKRSKDALLLLSFVVALFTTLFGSVLFFAEQTGQRFNVTDNTWYRFSGEKSPFQVSACLWRVYLDLVRVLCRVYSSACAWALFVCWCMCVRVLVLCSFAGACACVCWCLCVIVRVLVCMIVRICYLVIAR